MLKKTTIFLCLFLFLFSSISFANERWFVARDDEHITVLLDTETLYTDRIKRTDKRNGKIVSCWIKMILKSDAAKDALRKGLKEDQDAANVDASRVSYGLLRQYFDVNNGEYGEEVALYFDDAGRQIYSEEIPQYWDPIQPESDNEKILFKIKEKLKI